MKLKEDQGYFIETEYDKTWSMNREVEIPEGAEVFNVVSVTDLKVGDCFYLGVMQNRVENVVYFAWRKIKNPLKYDISPYHELGIVIVIPPVSSMILKDAQYILLSKDAKVYVRDV